MRLHHDPAALPPISDAPGTNRDDLRPNTADRYRIRYAATTLRGCLLESLAWLRPDPDAAAREAAVSGDGTDLGAQVAATAAQAIHDHLDGRRVAVITGPHLTPVSIDDPLLQADLDREPVVRALLDSEEGRAALASSSSARSRRPRLDGAAVRLSTPLGRDLTRAASLALYDRPSPPDGVHHRSRHDDAEDCWALYEHASVEVGASVPLSPSRPDHRVAVRAVAQLWDLPLPAAW